MDFDYWKTHTTYVKAKCNSQLVTTYFFLDFHTKSTTRISGKEKTVMIANKEKHIRVLSDRNKLSHKYHQTKEYPLNNIWIVVVSIGNYYNSKINNV